jgi:hypothetical protein
MESFDSTVVFLHGKRKHTFSTSILRIMTPDDSEKDASKDEKRRLVKRVAHWVHEYALFLKAVIIPTPVCNLAFIA